MHYGVSIKDGAPGVGTGNWRRDGIIGGIAKIAEDYKRKKEEKKKNAERAKWNASNKRADSISEGFHFAKSDEARKALQETKTVRKESESDDDIERKLYYRSEGINSIFEKTSEEAKRISSGEEFDDVKHPYTSILLARNDPKKQTELLKRASPSYEEWERIRNTQEGEDSINIYAAFQHITSSASCDWYNGEAFTAKSAKILNNLMDSTCKMWDSKYGTEDYDKYHADEKKYETELLGQVLKDIGYKNTEENREYLYDIVFWD